MTHLLNHFRLALLLLTISVCFTACNEQSVPLENQKIQFALSPSSADGEDINLPENAHAKITVTSSNGSSILTDHEIAVHQEGGIYTTDALDLISGSYSITDFVIIHDSVELYVAPKKGAELATTVSNVLPLNFSIDERHLSTLTMHVADVRDQDLRKFGYISAKAKANTIAIAVHEPGATALTSATVEVRQNKKLLDVLSLTASINSITLSGDHKLPYTLTIYTSSSADTRTFTLKELKKENGKKPLHVQLKPALILSIESYVDEANEYEEYFDFRLDGSGTVNVNWGDGQQDNITLPSFSMHEYFTGKYKAIITGDIHRITDFAGFSYSSTILAITGLTNLTALKVYDPSWGAVPIKVDLSNCKELERINVAKYGAPYEPCDLRTEFKLPAEHMINAFIFDAPSFDSNREFISAEELDVMVNNVYNNTVNRSIYNGKFFVNPVVAPSAAAQQKLDVLTNQYNWQVGFNDEIYNAYEFDGGRTKDVTDPDVKREQWLRERFSNSQQIIERAPAAAMHN